MANGASLNNPARGNGWSDNRMCGPEYAEFLNLLADIVCETARRQHGEPNLHAQ